MPLSASPAARPLSGMVRGGLAAAGLGALLIGGLGTLPARAAGTGGAMPAGVEIAPHRALYTLKLDKAQNGSGVVSAEGQMLYEWSDVCDGWVVEQRYRMTIGYSEADDLELNISFVTWEAKDGSRYRFSVKKLHDGELNEELMGTATMPKSGAGEAVFTKPGDSRYPLAAGTMFPSNHTLAMLEAAAKGQKFFASPVFDGGVDEGAADVSVAIGREFAADEAATDPLLKQRGWPMRLAFFPASAEAGSATPDYELSMDVLANGVTRGMVLDYGTFAVRAKLGEIKPLPKPSC